MGTISTAFSIISSALDAEQAGLSIIAGNVANANTPGYTRQNPTFHESTPLTINGQTYGSGVIETGATSVRDRVLESRIDQQQQLASASSARLQALNTMQTLFTPDSGNSTTLGGDIGQDITNFFNAFASLEGDATSNALRQQVLSQGRILAGDISNTANGLLQQQAALDQEAGSVATQINALTAAIAELNHQIQSISPDGDAGTLEDQRQYDLNQLSQLIGINQITTEKNGMTITTTSGQVLVSQGKSFAVTTGTVSGLTHFFIGSTDVTGELASGGGELGGFLMARDQDIPSALSALDNLAYYISNAVNAQNAAGSDLNGNPGGAIFATPGTVAGSAQSMSVVMTDPNGVAAAAAGAAADSSDNSNAVLLAGIATQASTLPNGLPPNNYYANLVTSLGSTITEVETENTAQQASLTQLQSQRNSLSQVNLNDEAAALSTLQRSYQAASQFFTIMDSIMAAALNLGEQTAVA